MNARASRILRRYAAAVWAVQFAEVYRVNPAAVSRLVKPKTYRRRVLKGWTRTPWRQRSLDRVAWRTRELEAQLEGRLE